MKWRWTSPYWVKKDTNYKDYNLTKDSWKMMDEIVIDREKNKISPLKDEPWERQPYVKYGFHEFHNQTGNLTCNKKINK